ncbi:MAG TPA: AsnC family transcriptional regulator [Solirubrobacteraceae bacterium]|nr:AsnC family transcriptional regulator [Solirubrobacteraceae bacterium]
MKDPLLDDIDRKLIHALSVDARAPFRTLGEVCGCSDQTAARRYRRLQEVAALRVVGDVEAFRVGWDDWLLRLQCTPAGTTPVAEALSRRPDTRWVQLASGGTEIVCVLQARTPEQRDALLLKGLPGSRHVVQVAAHLMLEAYSPETWGGITSTLTPAELARLCPPRVDSDGAPVALDELDHELLTHLGEDGRASHSQIAAAIHTHESTVRRRIDELRRAGALVFEIDIDTRALGMNTHAYLWLSVAPSELESVGTALATHPEVAYAGATTGRTNLFASVVFTDSRHMYEYLNRRLATLPGIHSVEAAPSIRTLKRTGAAPPLRPTRPRTGS